MKNILLTSDAGYIGSHVAHLLLDNGYNITIINNLITGDKKLVPNKTKLFIRDIGNQKKVYLKNFISTLEKKLNKKANKNNMSMQKGDIKKTLSNTNLLYQIIKYKLKVNYINRISAFVEWYKKYNK